MKFERVIKYETDETIKLPERATKHSAGYDFCAAEDVVIPPYQEIVNSLNRRDAKEEHLPWEIRTLQEQEKFTENFRPTLVPTGIKCKLDSDKYLQLVVRSSCPLKYWLVLANGAAIIDADYYGNPKNDGEIFFQLINLSPYPVKIQKGDKIGQGIILPYYTVEQDNAQGERVGGFGSTSEQR